MAKTTVSPDFNTAVGYLQKKGWTRNQAVGIASNLQHESGFKLDAIGDQGTAFGIAQWRGDRVKNFEKVIGKPITEASLTEQLDFIDHELRTTETRAGKALAKATDPGKAADVFARQYERPANPNKDAAIRSSTATAFASGNFELGAPLQQGEATAVAKAAPAKAAPANTPADTSTATVAGGQRIERDAVLQQALKNLLTGDEGGAQTATAMPQESAPAPQGDVLAELMPGQPQAPQDMNAPGSAIAALRNLTLGKMPPGVVNSATGEWAGEAKELFDFDQIEKQAARNQDATLAQLFGDMEQDMRQDTSRLPAQVDRYLDKLLA